MVHAYVITENKSDTEVLCKLLPEDLVNSTEIVNGGGSYGAQSLAGSLLATRRLPVALVVDADTDDADAISDREVILREFLQQRSAGNEQIFQLSLMVPAIEIVFFEDRALIEQLVGRPLSDLEWMLAKHAPKALLDSLPGGRQANIARILDNLTPVQLHEIRNHPVLKNLISFLAAAVPQEV